MPEGALKALTAHTITDPMALEIEIARVRQQGWAAAPEEFTLGINALGAPIYDQRGQIVAAIALLDSVQMLGRQPAPRQVSTIMDAAAEISATLSLKPVQR